MAKKRKTDRQAAVRSRCDRIADAAMMRLWKEWFTFYTAHFRAPGLAISAADQMAFYEIAQPIMRDLKSPSVKA